MRRMPGSRIELLESEVVERNPQLPRCILFEIRDCSPSDARGILGIREITGEHAGSRIEPVQTAEGAYPEGPWRVRRFEAFCDLIIAQASGILRVVLVIGIAA